MGWGGRGQVGYERRIEVFVKIKKKNISGGGGGSRVGVGGQGVCERRIEVIVEIKKKSGRGGGQVRPGMRGLEGWGLVEGVGW